MAKYNGGILAKNKELYQKLLKLSQSPPKDTLFDEGLFENTLDSVKGSNETRVIRDISQLIVPSAEILTIHGAQHLKILRETTNAGWKNAIPFYGSRPQPDYSLGFKREAFTKEQLQKLQPFIGNDLEDCSYFAATYNMYFPFLTSEVKCGASALDIADRQNTHSQTALLRGLFELFRLVGRENELHTIPNGFSFSHSDVDVRIWSHLLVATDGKEPEYYRDPIASFSIETTAQADNRWIAWTVTMNILNLWVEDHFKWICSAIDMLPTGLSFDVSELSGFPSGDPDLASSQSGLSQQLGDYALANDHENPNSQPSVQPITADPTVESRSRINKKKKK